jgi:hypothetical protein
MTINVLFAQTDDDRYFLEDIDKTFVGYYVSVDFIAVLERTKNYAFAWDMNRERTYYAHIIVCENKMEYYPFYSDCYFEVSKKAFKYYFFDCNSIDEMIIIDPNGNRYKKMTNVYDYENYNRIMNNYIGNVVLAELIKDGRIIIEDDYIYIQSLDNKRLKIVSWQSYYGENVNLLLVDCEINKNWWVLLKVKDNEYTIFYDPPLWHKGQELHIIWKTEMYPKTGT